MIAAEDGQALALSLRVAVTSLALTLPPAIALGYLLSRRRFPGKALIEASLNLPLVVPPVATGYALLVLFGTRGALGARLAEFGTVFAFRWSGAALAAAVMSFPLVAIAARSAFDGVDRRLAQAAATLGAGPWRRFLTIDLPLAAPGLAAGAVLGFARAFGEFGATIGFVGNVPGETRTLPIAIWERLNTPGGEAALGGLVAVSLAVALAASLLAAGLRRRTRATADDTHA